MGYPKNSHGGTYKKLDEAERSLKNIQTGVRSTTLISESGLYKLVLRSSKPEAKKFQPRQRRSGLGD